MNDLQNDIKDTLKNILEYIGADMKYAEYAQLHKYLKIFANKVKESEQ